MQLLRRRIIPCWPDSGQICIISNVFWGPSRRRLFPRNVSGGVWRLERWLYSQACLSLLFYSQSNSFVEALGPETKFTQFKIVLWWYWEKKGNSLDTRYNSCKFRYFGFLALQNLQNLQLEHPPNWLNSTL